MQRRWLVATVALGASLSFAACSRGNNQAADTALNNDLSLAAQQKQAQLDSLSDTANAANKQALASGTTRSATTHSTTYRHRSSSSSGGYRSSGEVTTTTSSGGTVVKHTKRDAAIGAATGAVVGGVASHSVKGGIIGAVVGGVLGGVIGNNVDKTKKP